MLLASWEQIAMLRARRTRGSRRLAMKLPDVKQSHDGVNLSNNRLTTLAMPIDATAEPTSVVKRCLKMRVH